MSNTDDSKRVTSCCSRDILADYRLYHYPTQLTDDHLMWMWGQLERDKNVSRVFHDGYVTGPVSFVDFVSREDVHFYGIYFNDQPMAMAWLCGSLGNTMMTHFSGLFSCFRKHTVNCGLKFCRTMLNAKKADGSPYVDVLSGLTPETNRLALRFIKRLGFHPIGTIPGLFTIEGEKVGGVVSYLTKETVMNMQPTEVR